MKNLILALVLFATPLIADIGLDLIGVTSNDLGYERYGGGLQLDIDGRLNDWGWDGQATTLKHSKFDGDGERYQAMLFGRRFVTGDWFIEAGVEHGGYETRFEDKSKWKKFGTSVGVGLGQHTNSYEWSVRYLAPDTSPNKTSVVNISGEVMLTPSVALGSTIERWSFDVGQERLNGTQITIELGWRW